MRYVFEGCVLDTEQYVLDKSGLSIALPPKVFQVLLYLLQHRNRVVAKQELCEQIWPEQFISDATVESAIKAIRRAVGDDGRTQWCIQTRRGQGYRFVAPVTVLQVEAQEVAERVSPATDLGQGAVGAEPVETSLDVSSLDASHVALVSPAALRRQLTVMFCHLMDAGALAEQLDPEDLREVMLACHTACDAVITRFDGHTAQYLGNGLFVYFGYPMAHEDDAARAVRCALRIVEAVDNLNAQLESHYGARLSVRLGIHTGPVVLGPPHETHRQDTLAWGMTPNIASRLQEVAAPNTVVLSAVTYALIEGYFICHTLGEWEFEGIARPIQAYQALRLSGAESRLEIAGHRGLTPFVGRTTELLVLRERWKHVTAGIGQVVLLTGEAGIGKSRLVQHFQTTIAEPHLWLEGRGSPHFQHSAFHAVRALLKHVLPQDAEELPDDDRLKTLETILAHLYLHRDEMVPLLAPFLDLSLPTEHDAPFDLSPQEKRDKTFEALLTLVSALAVEQPVVILVEDLHWVDPSTLEFLSLLIDQGPMARVYSLFTFRPDFDPPWGSRAHMASITLTPFSPVQVTQMIDNLTSGKILPVEIVDHLMAKTDGVPLFIEEMTKSMLESDQLIEKRDHYEQINPVLSLSTPLTLNDALMERLDRLGSTAGIVQLGATIGRQFSYRLIHAISQLDEQILRRELSKLVASEFFYQQGVMPQATYLFKHALIQDVAYQSLLRSTRRRYHERIAKALEAQFPKVVVQQPEVLARHYTEAGDTEAAVIYWLQAGQNASTASAYREAQAHLRTGLELLNTHPDTPARAEQERRLQLALGHVQMIVEGFSSPATEQTFVQTLTLARASGDLGDHLQALRGLSAIYTQQGKLQTARVLAEQSLDLAQRVGDVEGRLHAHRNLGLSLIHLGELMAAQTHFEKALALSEGQPLASNISPGRYLRVESLGFLAPALWARGYAEQAMARIREMLALAHARIHPYSLCDALMDASLVYGNCGAWKAAQELADEGLALAIERGFVTYRERGLVLRGRALMGQERLIEGIALLQAGLAALQATGAQRRQVQMSPWLIEAYGRNGQVAEALALLDDALTLAQVQEARLDEQRLYHLKGVLLLSLSDKHQGESEHWFRQALILARACEAKPLELQAVMSLARLWQSQGKRQDAYDLLAPVYDWFTEGFDTADLQEAKAILHELR